MAGTRTMQPEFRLPPCRCLVRHSFLARSAPGASDEPPFNRVVGSRVPHVTNREWMELRLSPASCFCDWANQSRVSGFIQIGLPGEQAPGLSVLHGHRQSSTASYLVTSDFSGAVLTEDALGILETVGSGIRGDAGDLAAVICDGAMD